MLGNWFTKLINYNNNHSSYHTIIPINIVI